MTLDEAISFVTRAAFVLIPLILAVQYVRFRDAMRRDALLMFGTFAVAIVAGEAARIAGVQNRWIQAATALAVMAQPHLLLRLTHAFRPVPRAMIRATMGGLALSATLLAAVPQPLPRWATLVLVAYFAVVEGYAAALLIGAARRSTGVAHRRLVLVGQGSALLAAVILLAGVQALLPGLRPVSQPASRLLALLCVVWYFLGFTPPAPLRRAWQLAELHDFLRGIAGFPARDRAATILTNLCGTASRTVGARGSLAAIAEVGTDPLVIRAADVDEAARGEALDPAGIITRTWRERGPARTVPRDRTTGIVHRIAASRQCDRVLIVPIASAETAWGVLIVLQPGASLFPEDDQELLALVGEQTALVLDLGALLAEQQRLIDRLRDSTTQLERANKELEAFSYSVSHDLRAPLRAIDGFTRILLDEVLPDPPAQARHYLDRVRSNARQMGELIDDLLTFSRLSRQPLTRRALRPEAVVDDALQDLRHEQDGRAVEIVVGDLPACEGDAALIRQVFANLLANALKFTRKVDRARIEVGSLRQNGTPVYYVRDNGVGFDMRYVDKLFGVFQRLHRMEEYEGTGVGLAIVQRIVHRHGGRVWAEAAPDRGATFYFTLGGGETDGEHAPR